MIFLFFYFAQRGLGVVQSSLLLKAVGICLSLCLGLSLVFGSSRVASLRPSRALVSALSTQPCCNGPRSGWPPSWGPSACSQGLGQASLRAERRKDIHLPLGSQSLAAAFDFCGYADTSPVSAYVFSWSFPIRASVTARSLYYDSHVGLVPTAVTSL